MATKKQATLEDVMERIASLDLDDTYELFMCGEEHMPDEEDLVEFEAEVGYRFPEQFRDFVVSPAGAMTLLVRDELWPDAEADDTGPYWSFQKGLLVFGIADGLPEWVDLRVQYREFEQKELVPFLRRHSARERYCFKSDGQIVEWHPDEPESATVVKESFIELLLKEIDAMEERKDRRLTDFPPVKQKKKAKRRRSTASR